MKRYLFVDRDGTLVHEPEDQQVDALTKIRLRAMAVPSLLALRRAGFSLVMISNQDGLGTPSFPLADFTAAHEFILGLFSSQGVDFEQVLICPHTPEQHCACRKPALGLVGGYLADGSWDRRHSYVIGDRDSDAQLAANMGLSSFILTDACGWEDITAQILAEARGDRRARVERVTRETAVRLSVNLDEPAPVAISTGIGFFDHMLEQIATHAGISLQLTVQGDLQVDAHHSIEDTGLALGQALREALGDKRGLARFGFCLPMDEVYARVFAGHLLEDDDTRTELAMDISDRPYANFQLDASLTREDVGDFPTQMVPHFFRSLAHAMGLSLYMSVSSGNAHHQVEALFKAFGRALRQAIRVEGTAIPSSKGTLG